MLVQKDFRQTASAYASYLVAGISLLLVQHPNGCVKMYPQHLSNSRSKGVIIQVYNKSITQRLKHVYHTSTISS